MGETFYISIDGVRRLTTNIRQTASDLKQSSTLGDDCHCLAPDDSEADHLDNRIRNFFHTWSDGMDKISGQLSDIADALDKALDAYSNTEQQIVTAETPQ